MSARKGERNVCDDLGDAVVETCLVPVSLAAQLMGIRRQTVYRKIERGTVDAVRVRGWVLVRVRGCQPDS